jgi:putative hydrolase of the HAD superfamily
MLEAVTFDFWQTILREPLGELRGRQVEAFARILSDAGSPVSRDELRDAFRRNWDVFEERWAANTGPYTHVHATDFIADRLGVRLVDGLRDRLVSSFDEVGMATPLDLAPGIEACLDALRTSGLRLGIVSDVGLTGAPVLRARLERYGLLDRFDAWGFSDETGWFKPAPEAFLPVLGSLGVDDPSRVAHFGDSRRTDVAGALALGMTAIRYTGFREDPEDGPAAPHVVASHADVPAVLGLDPVRA